MPVGLDTSRNRKPKGNTGQNLHEPLEYGSDEQKARNESTLAVALLRSDSAHSETLYERDGITLEGTAQIATQSAAICLVAERQYSAEVCEQIKVNHGQPLQVWRLAQTRTSRQEKGILRLARLCANYVSVSTTSVTCSLFSTCC